MLAAAGVSICLLLSVRLRADELVAEPLQKSAAIESTIDALVANGSDTAWQTLQRLVKGEIELGTANRLAAQLALVRLAEHPNGANEAFLFRALTAPREVRPEGRGRYSSTELQQDAAVMFSRHASVAQRSQLAELLKDEAFDTAARRLVTEIVLAHRPANVPAQISLFLDEKTPAAVRDDLLTRLATANASALRGRLGLSDEDPADSALADALWQPSFVERLAAQASNADTFDAPRVALLASLPTDAARRRLAALLETHWKLGPQAFVSGVGAPSPQATKAFSDKSPPSGTRGVWNDPGATVIAKSVPHVASPTKEASPPRRGRTREKPASNSAEMRTEYAWFIAIGMLVKAQLDQFAAAAKAPTGAAAEKLPFGLHPGATVKASFLVDLKQRDGADPLLVSYLRIEQLENPEKLLRYYQRQLRRPVPHPVPRGIWMSSADRSESGDRVHSIDVVIREEANTAPNPALGTEPRPLKLEILLIEIATPQGDPASQSPVQGKPTPPAVRTWTDRTGRHKIEAELVAYDDGIVKLKKSDGKIVSVPATTLSDADQQFLKSLKP